MLEISNVKVYDLVESVLASGYSMMVNPYPDKLSNYLESDPEFQEGVKRLSKLTKIVSDTGVGGHDNALIGIRVSFDVKYPQYWSKEYQRYHFSDIVLSSSLMHRLHMMKLSECCNKYVDKGIIDLAQRKIDRYNSLKASGASGDELYAAFMEMISNCPMGVELFMRVTTNYKQLQTIYRQRLHHKLKEDWGAVCDMIESLPYAKELGIC